MFQRKFLNFTRFDLVLIRIISWKEQFPTSIWYFVSPTALFFIKKSMSFYFLCDFWKTGLLLLLKVFLKLKKLWFRQSILFWISVKGCCCTVFIFCILVLYETVITRTKVFFVFVLFPKKIDARKISNHQYLVTNCLWWDYIKPS